MDAGPTVQNLTIQGNNPASLIAAAISGGADLDKLEKLMALQHKWEEGEAKKAFVAAMAAFKANPPRIERTKQVSFSTSKGTTEYRHAVLAEVAAAVNSELSRHGLSAGWRTTQTGKEITVTCTITHVMGHSESTSLTASPDDSGGKNSIQAIGSTVTYLERYTLLSLTGLASHEMDDDGRRSEVKYISDEQSNTLHAMVSENELNANGKWLGQFLSYLKVESFDELPADQYGKAKTALEGIIKKQQARGKDA